MVNSIPTATLSQTISIYSSILKGSHKSKLGFVVRLRAVIATTSCNTEGLTPQITSEIKLYIPDSSTTFLLLANMFSNRILRSKLVGKIVKGGTEIAIAAATKTRLWTRPDIIADQRAPGFIKSVNQDPKLLPRGTSKVIMRSASISM